MAITTLTTEWSMINLSENFLGLQVCLVIASPKKPFLAASFVSKLY